MSIEFSDQAKEQLKRRGITQKEVLAAVKAPDKTESSFRGRKLRRKSVSGKILEVVSKTEDSRTTVITAYYLEEE